MIDGAPRRIARACGVAALVLWGGSGCGWVVAPPAVPAPVLASGYRTLTAAERKLPCVLDDRAAWRDPQESARVDTEGFSFKAQGNVQEELGEHNGLGFFRLPGRQRELIFSAWNLEHVFDGVQHEGNLDPRHDRLFEPRQPEAVMDVFKLTPTQVVLYQKPTPFWGLESATRFSARGGDTIDVTFSARLTRPTPKTDWVGLFWATYPSMPGLPLYFPGRTGPQEPLVWIEGRSRDHMVRSTFLHESDPGRIDFATDYPDKLFTTTAVAREVFAYPVFYGVLPEGPTFATMLDGGGDVRITHSPLSAWDVQWIIHGWQVGACYTLRARLLLGSGLTAASIIENYELWSGEDVPELPAEPVPSNPDP